jgi:hypothetical protein
MHHRTGAAETGDGAFRPGHTSPTFAVSRYEITRGEYEAFVQATGRAVGGDCSDGWLNTAPVGSLYPNALGIRVAKTLPRD